MGVGKEYVITEERKRTALFILLITEYGLVQAYESGKAVTGWQS